ncbi:hypothetical protein D9M71_137260 [compost metagenome]
MVVAVGGADQGEAFQVGNGEDDAAVLVLQDVGMLAVVQARHDQVAALHQADVPGRGVFQVVAQEAADPGTGGIDQRMGADRVQAAVVALQVQVPQPLAAPRADAAGARVDMRAVLAGADGVEHHQPGVVHGAVGILEAAADFRLERTAGAELQAARSRQLLALAQVVVEEQPGADHPRRAQVRLVRQDEAHRPDDVRRLVQQDFALGEGFAHQAQFAVFQIAQAAVDQLAAGGRGMAGEVVLFAKEHGKPAPGGIRRDAHAVDAAADHGEVVDFGHWGGMIVAAHLATP